MLFYRTPAFSVGWAARSATAGGFAQTAGGSNRFGAFAGRDTFYLRECRGRGYLGGGNGAEKEKIASGNFSGNRPALRRAQRR